MNSGKSTNTPSVSEVISSASEVNLDDLEVSDMSSKNQKDSESEVEDIDVFGYDSDDSDNSELSEEGLILEDDVEKKNAR